MAHYQFQVMYIKTNFWYYDYINPYPLLITEGYLYQKAT